MAESFTRNGGKLKSLPVGWLERGRLQPRRVIDGTALKHLADSIRSRGLIQPIFVRKKQRGRFEIIAGERRWHAAKMAGLKEIPTVIGDVSDESALAFALIENLHREDLNPIDQALAMRRLVDEFGMTHQEIANTIGRSRAAVTNLLRLLELPGSVCDLVADGELDMGHARALLALPDDEREKTARYAAARQMSVRGVEAMVKRQRQPEVPDGDRSDVRDRPDEREARDEPRRQLSFRQNEDGSYDVRLHFATRAELEHAIEELRHLSSQLEEPVAAAS